MTQDPRTTPYPGPEVVDEPHDRYLPDDPLTGFSQESEGSDPSDTKDVAKDKAAQVGQGAADAGKHVAGVAKDEASSVVGEAKSQAKDVLGQARGEVREQAGSQQQRAAQGLQSISRELGSMAEGSEQQGVAAELARQVSQRAGEMASWLEGREPEALLDDVRAFARRRPGAFLGIALAAGVVAGRLTRGMTSSGDDTPAGSAGPGAAGTSGFGSDGGLAGDGGSTALSLTREPL